MTQLTIDEFRAIMREGLPFAQAFGVQCVELDSARAVFRVPYREDFLRPGGTISGPLLMGVADLAIYGIVLATIGRVELAVTTSLTMNFLRKPPAADLEARARLLRLGSRLAVGEVELYTDGEAEMVAHAVATYSIPPTR